MPRLNDDILLETGFLRLRDKYVGADRREVVDGQVSFEQIETPAHFFLADRNEVIIHTADTLDQHIGVVPVRRISSPHKIAQIERDDRIDFPSLLNLAGPPGQPTFTLGVSPARFQFTYHFIGKEEGDCLWSLRSEEPKERTAGHTEKGDREHGYHCFSHNRYTSVCPDDRHMDPSVYRFMRLSLHLRSVKKRVNTRGSTDSRVSHLSNPPDTRRFPTPFPAESGCHNSTVGAIIPPPPPEPEKEVKGDHAVLY